MYQVTEYQEREEEIPPVMDLLTRDNIPWIIKEKKFKREIKYAGFRTDNFTPSEKEVEVGSCGNTKCN